MAFVYLEIKLSVLGFEGVSKALQPSKRIIDTQNSR